MKKNPRLREVKELACRRKNLKDTAAITRGVDLFYKVPRINIRKKVRSFREIDLDSK